MQNFGPATEGAYTFVDRPKTSLKVVTLLVWTVSRYLIYKAVVQPPPQPWAVPGILLIFALCSYSVLHEFMLRPMRVTTIRPLERQIVVQETARWRKTERVISIPRGDRFEIFQCDSDNAVAHGVRIRSTDRKWLTVAEYLSKDAAEGLARDANSRLGG